MCKEILVEYEPSLPTKKSLKMKLRISNAYGYIKEIQVLFNKHGEEPGIERYTMYYNSAESTDRESVFVATMEFEAPGYRTFYIQLTVNDVNKKIQYDAKSKQAILTEENLAFFELFVYQANFQTPDWVKGGIMYQIYVDTFCSKDLSLDLETERKVVQWNVFQKWMPDEDGVYRNDQFYGGNLKGIIEKLPYIKSLGTTILYLTPIFKSPSSNRYDIEDYEKIDDMVGTWEQLDELHKKANSIGIFIIIDVVFNHSSNKNQLLQKFPDMYEWEQKYTIPKCWWGYDSLVQFEQNSEIYLSKLNRWIDIYRFYTDGFRVDVADNMKDFTLEYIRQRLGVDKYILGEVWKNAITGDFRAFLGGNELDGVMNYQFANAIYRYIRYGNDKYFTSIVENICRLYPKQALDVSPIFLDSHDTPRIPNILVGEFMQESPEHENIWDMEKDGYWWDGGQFDTFKFRKWEAENDEIPEDKRELADKLQRLAVFLQYTLPGLPSIFAGDEVGVMGYKDPFNRKPFPWDKTENGENSEIFRLYQELGQFRNNYREIFAHEDFEIIMINKKMLLFRRKDMYFCLNRTDKSISTPWEDFCGKEIVFHIGEIQNNQIPPYGVMVIK